MGQAPSLPALYSQPGSPANSLLGRCPSLHEPYAPPVICEQAGIHLIAATVVQGLQNNRLRVRRQLLTLEDKGNVSLDWWTEGRGAAAPRQTVPSSAERADPLDPAATTPLAPAGPAVVLILHVFSGTSKDCYLRALANWCLKEGWLPVSMNARGCGDLQLTSPKPNIPGQTEDVYAAVLSIKEQHPGSPVFCVGYSNGAYTLVKYMADVDAGRLGAEGSLAGGVAAHSGYDYKVEMDKISDGSGCLNIDFFERSFWHTYIQQHKVQLRKNSAVDWGAIKRARSTHELESHFVLPIHGFKDMATYHQEVNAITLIPQIRTPLLFISAKDDLCLNMSIMPAVIAAIEASSHSALALTTLGGHCSHLRRGALWPVRSFVDDATVDFFSAVLCGPLPGEAEAEDLEEGGAGGGAVAATSISPGLRKKGPGLWGGAVEASAAAGGGSEIDSVSLMGEGRMKKDSASGGL